MASRSSLTSSFTLCSVVLFSGGTLGSTASAAPGPSEEQATEAPVETGELTFEGRDVDALKNRFIGAGYRRMAKESRVIREALDVLAWACEDSRAPSLCESLGNELSRMRARRAEYGEAFGILLAACRASTPGACTATLGFRSSASTRGMDAPTLKERLELGCSDGRYETCAQYGRRVEADRRVDVWEAGCAGGNGASCALLAKRVRKTDPERSDVLADQACASGHGPTCWREYRDDKRPMRPERDSEDYEKLVRICDLGGGVACERVARVELDGKRREQDPVEALARLDDACDTGRTSACRRAGRMHRRGEGTEKNRSKYRYYRLERGEPRAPARVTAQLGLPGILALRGEGVLPLPIGPAISVGGAIGGTPAFDPVIPRSRTIQGDVRLYPRHAARGFYVGGMLADLSWVANSPTFGQSSTASSPPGRNDDQAWGEPEARLGGFTAGFKVGTVTQRGHFVLGLEAGVSVITSQWTRSVFVIPLFESIPGFLPTLNLEIGSAVR